LPLQRVGGRSKQFAYHAHFSLWRSFDEDIDEIDQLSWSRIRIWFGLQLDRNTELRINACHRAEDVLVLISSAIEQRLSNAGGMEHSSRFNVLCVRLNVPVFYAQHRTVDPGVGQGERQKSRSLARSI
jgi:hypothetical protein